MLFALPHATSRRQWRSLFLSLFLLGLAPASFAQTVPTQSLLTSTAVALPDSGMPRSDKTPPKDVANTEKGAAGIGIDAKADALSIPATKLPTESKLADAVPVSFSSVDSAKASFIKASFAPVVVPVLSGMSLSLTEIVSGHPTNGFLTLSHAAPESGVIVTLSSSSPEAFVPAQVIIPSGKKTVSFPVTTTATAAAAKATVSATYEGVTRNVGLSLKPAVLTGLVLSPASAGVGETQTGTVMLSGPAPAGGVTIVLSSNNSLAHFPQSVTIAPGSQSAPFSFLNKPTSSRFAQGTSVPAASKTLLSASFAGVVRTAAVTPKPAVATSSLRIDTGAAATYTDSLGNIWSVDTSFTSGTVEAPTPVPTIANTADAKLYQTQRVETTAGSSFTYTLPVTNGTYVVGLLFAEIDGKTTGQRVFGVTANGTALLTGFDIYSAAGGANKAVTKGFLVTVTTGQIVLVFTGTTGQAAVSAISVNVPGGGTPSADAAAPGWAEDVIPADQSDAGGNGPSASLSVSLPSGVLENHPGPDLDVFNPTGPSISYERLYRSALAAAGVYTSGLSPGWRDSYSLTITNKGSGNYTLNYPNGGGDNWSTVTGTITPSSGTPYLVSTSGSNIVMTFKDHSYYTFTPNPNNASSYLLTGLSNLVGSTVTINRDAANGGRITTFTNGGTTPLLTLNYSASGLANITDTYGRVVTYTFSGTNLSTVSQVNAASAIRWQYGYTAIGSQPFLNAVMVPDPSSGTMSEADPQYTPDGHVAALKDAEGNQRTYNYGPQGVAVSVYSADGNLSQTWTRKFDAAHFNVDKGVIDAFGNATNLTYGDTNNPLKVTAATNKNGQTAIASFDKYGNTAAVSDLRSVTTQNTYDPAFPLGQVSQVQVGANQPVPKTPANFTYYDGTTQVGGVTQANGLMKTMSVPTPGTTGTGSQVISTYVYTALGNALTVTSPGPNTSGGTVTTTYNYTSDSLYDGNGNPLQTGAPAYTTTERLQQPLTVTDPLGNMTHYRYDSQGNTVIAISAPVVSAPDTTVARPLRTDYAYNAKNQLISVTYPALNPSTPTFRDSTVYTYEYIGGPLLTTTELTESNSVVRQTNIGKGKEDEQKSQAGSIQQANFNFDPQYRVKQEIDGNSNPAKSFKFDAVGNLTSKTYALGDGPKFTQYDKDINLMQMVDGRGITTTYTRAADDSRITGATYSDGTPSPQFGTNGNGYDVYDRVTGFTDSVGSHTATYDDDDNLLTKTTTYAGLPAATISYSYNNNGSRATLTAPKTLSGSAYVYWTFGYSYDANGQITNLTCPWVKSSTSTGLAVLSYSYDELGRLLKQHTQKGDTFYVYNSRSWLVQQQSSNTFPVTSFVDPSSANPPKGTIPNRTAQGQSVTGNLNYCLLDDYSNMQYDSLGNRLRMDVTIPDFYIYDTTGNYTSYPPLNKDIDGSLFYAYDTKDRLTLETTTNSSGTQTFEDYALSGGAFLYNSNWNYQINADLADNLTTLRGNTQTFNANNQLTTETYDGAGNRTSYNGGAIVYDANGLPLSVPGNGGATPFTQAFTGGERAWKQPSGGSKTYYLYDGDEVLMELDSTGAPVSTYAAGPGGLLERFQHKSSGVPYVMYLFDPNGNLVHRVRSIDPNVSSGAAVLVQDTALYDSQGLLHADIDTLTGGFNSGHLDPIGYKGEKGNYTDVETQKAVAGLYTALSGPGGSGYYDPLTGISMARDAADSANETSDNLNSLEPALHNAYVDITGMITGPVGAGIIDGQLTYYETGNVKTAFVRGGTTAVVGIVFGRAGGIVGRPLGRIIANRLSARAATVVAGAESREATGAFHSLSDPIADVSGPGHISDPEEYDRMLFHMADAGVHIDINRPGTYSYHPGIHPGDPGQLRLDPNSSIGAVRHEYQHFLDDEAAGRPGASHYMADQGAQWRFERRAYMVEIAMAKKLGSVSARRQLIENAMKQKRHIYGR